MEYESVHEDDGDVGFDRLGTSELVEFEFDPIRFAEFDVWLDSELDRLVETWQHLAAPNAMRFGRFKAARNR